MLAPVPVIKPVVRLLFQSVQLRLARQLCGQFQTNAVRVEKINRLENVVVGKAEHLDTVRFEPVSTARLAELEGTSTHSLILDAIAEKADALERLLRR